MERIDTVAFVREQKQLIFDQLESASQLQNEAAKKEKIDEMFLKADEVKKYVHQHLTAMIAYEIRVCNDLIKEIDSRISRERDAANKKPFKFSFSVKSGTGSSSSSTQSQPKPVDQVDGEALLSVKCASVGLSGLTGEVRVLNGDGIDHQEVVLDSLSECTISLHGAPSALRLVNLRQCTVQAGPVSGSVFIANCHQCRMQVAGHQLRIHDTTDCDIYQHVRSRSIVENCSKIRFGRYDWTYDRLDDDFAKAAMDRTVNNWRQIDDFDCLTNPSPNWSFLE